MRPTTASREGSTEDGGAEAGAPQTCGWGSSQASAGCELELRPKGWGAGGEGQQVRVLRRRRPGAGAGAEGLGNRRQDGRRGHGDSGLGLDSECGEHCVYYYLHIIFRRPFP